MSEIIVNNMINANDGFTAAGINYPTVDGFAGQAMVTDGAKNLSFSTIATYNPTSFIIPWTSWNYFVGGGGGGDYYWAPALSQNSSGFDGTPNTTFGTVNFNAPIDGTYQFTMGMRTGTNIGMMTATINGVATPLDGYNGSGQSFISFVWTQSLTAGVWGIAIDSLSKNTSSTNYWITPLGTGFGIQLL